MPILLKMIRESSGSRITILLTLFIVGLSIPLIDTILSLLRSLSANTVHCNWFAPLAVLTGIFLVSTSILFFIASKFAEFLKKDRVAVVLSAALFLIVFFLPVLLDDLFHFHLSRSQLLLLATTFLIAGIASGFAYIALAASHQWRPRFEEMMTSAAVLPVLLTEILMLIWTRKVFRFSPGWWLLFALVLTFFLTLRFFRKYKSPNLSIGMLICLTIVIGASSLLPSFHKEPAVARKSNSNHKIKRVILITIDTLRADALSCYSKGPERTPNIDRFAKDSILFRQAISSAPWTFPALTSIMTGVSPLVHSTTKYQSRIPRTLPMLAEYMNKAGYMTGSIGKNVFLLNHFSRGFSTLSYYPRPEPSSLGSSIVRIFYKRWCESDASTMQITELAERWIQNHAKDDFFLWIHYFDPHLPYTPDRKYLPPEKPAMRVGSKVSFDTRDRIRRGLLVPTPEERKWIETLYAAEARYVDDAVGRLILYLKEKQLYQESLIILSSDHGEEFWEHGDFAHGQNVFNELIQVPFLLKLPSVNEGCEITQRVSTTSITPTILEASGIRYSPESFSSPSLVPLFKASTGSMPDAPLVSTGLIHFEDRIAVTFEHYKYIRHLITGNEELFDLQEDPSESHPISAPAVLEKGRQYLADQQKAASLLQRHYGIAAEQTNTDASTIEMMRSLGYTMQ